MVFRYTLTFSSHGIDENKLRRAVESLGIVGVSIERIVQEKAARNIKLNLIEKKILDLVSDDLPHRRIDIMANLADQWSSATVSKAIEGLLQIEALKRLRHGVYGTPKVTEQQTAAFPARINPGSQGETYKGVLAALEEQPATMVQLRQQFGVSRQRIEQILSKAVERGEAQRIETVGERGQYLYHRSGVDVGELTSRTPALGPPRLSLLSSLAPGRLYAAIDLARHLGVQATKHIKERLGDLTRWGYVFYFEIGTWMFCGITPAGVSFPDYDQSAPKAPHVDFLEVFGEPRAKFLQAMRILDRPVKTIDLTYAVGGSIFEGLNYSSGQVVQRLERSALIERVERKSHANWRLTRIGTITSALVDQFLFPPTRDQLESNIKERMDARAERLRANGFDSLEATMALTHRSILVVAAGGEVSTADIPARMEVSFANPRSVNLAVKTLEERGYLLRARRDRRNGIVWAITEKGRAMAAIPLSKPVLIRGEIDLSGDGSKASKS